MCLCVLPVYLTHSSDGRILGVEKVCGEGLRRPQQDI